MKRRAVVRFLSSIEGGRFNPPSAGYKPQIKIDEILTSCVITPQNSNVNIMDFEIEHDVFIELQFEEIYGDKIFNGMGISLFEGSKLIAKGRFN